MILYYAVGGGLGHLTRGRRVLEILGLEKQATFVTASPYARDERVTGGIPVIEVPPHLEHAPAEHRLWLRDLIRGCGAERLIADAFPAGIQGELAGLPIAMDYVARILRLDEYRRVVTEDFPRFGTTWVVEELAADYAELVRAQSERIEMLDLRPTPLASVALEAFWLVVHSGPEEEVSELVEYAANLRDLAEARPERVVVASRCSVPLPNGFELTNEYPVAHLYPRAARIISAAGFNVMCETAAYAEKHHVVPFARRFDDQYLRAARRRVL
jgi:hypothetical protein